METDNKKYIAICEAIKQSEDVIVEELKKSDIIDIVKKDKDYEKHVREIIADTITELFRILWQHSSMVKALVK